VDEIRLNSSISDNIVITMKALPVTVRRIGNSLGVVIPKPVLAQADLSEQAEREFPCPGKFPDR
jgi:hypothetical protein